MEEAPAQADEADEDEGEPVDEAVQAQRMAVLPHKRVTLVSGLVPGAVVPSMLVQATRKTVAVEVEPVGVDTTGVLATTLTVVKAVKGCICLSGLA